MHLRGVLAFVALVAVLLVSGYLFIPQRMEEGERTLRTVVRFTPQPLLPIGFVSLNAKRILAVEWATTPESQERGLSFRPSLERDHGMLFMYTRPSEQRFWMYGMKFPLDIIFLLDGKVVSITAQIPTPSLSHIPIAVSESPANAVLELNAGMAEELGIQKGTLLQWR